MSRFGRDSIKWDDNDDDWEPSEQTNKPFEGVGTSISQRSTSFYSGNLSSQNVGTSTNSPESLTLVNQQSTSQTQKQVSTPTSTVNTVSNNKSSFVVAQKPVSTSAPTITPVPNTKPPFLAPQTQSSQPQNFLKPVKQTETQSSTTKLFDKPTLQQQQSSPSLLSPQTPNTESQTTTTGMYKLKSQQQQQQSSLQQQNQNQNLQPTKTQPSSFSSMPKQQNVQTLKVQNQTQSFPERVSLSNQQLTDASSVPNIGSTDASKNPLMNAQVLKGTSFGDRLRAQQLGGGDQIPRRPSITEPETTSRRNSATDENAVLPQSQSRSQGSDDRLQKQESTYSGPATIEELERDPESIRLVSKIIEEVSKTPEVVQCEAPKLSQLNLEKQQRESESLFKLKSLMSTLFHPGSSDFQNLPPEAKSLIEKILELN